MLADDKTVARIYSQAVITQLDGLPDWKARYYIGCLVEELATLNPRPIDVRFYLMQQFRQHWQGSSGQEETAVAILDRLAQAVDAEFQQPAEEVL
jgi:hypothetical protein